MKEFRISVRNMIEFILRSGDIDNRKDTGTDPDAMQEGQRIHKKIQKMMPAGYAPEVSLREVFTEEDLELTVEGRADGIWRKRKEVTGEEEILVDEIKSMMANLTYIDDPKPLHLAQAKCYAAMYARAEGLEKIGVQITYCDVDTEDIKRFQFHYRTAELREWFENVVREYEKWARMAAAHAEVRNASIQNLEFPYEYRPGQKDVARDVFRAIKRSRNLFINAPTGTGKTLSVIYPSLKAMGEGLSEKIFYLTAKTITATVAVDTLQLLCGPEEKKLRIKAVHITAKEKSCANECFECNPDMCQFADGHFDRINEAVYDIVTHESIITRELILSYAEKHRVCPYEFSLDISDWCDVIIGDYNYAFDPRVRLRRYFCTGAEQEYILLIDEAHNLVSRASEMYSATMIKEDILECSRLTKGMRKQLTSALTSANKKMLELKRECDEKYVLYTAVDELAKSLQLVFFELSKLLEKQKFFDTRDKVLEFFFKVKTFCDVCENMMTGYKIYGRIQDDGSFVVKLLCVDPSMNLSESLMTARSAVFFSATLLPMTYYKELLSGEPEDYAIYAETVFRQEQRLLMIGRDVTSRYTRRDASMYERIAAYIRRTAQSKAGNYIAYFPSYEFLKNVAGKLGIRKPEKEDGETETEALLPAENSGAEAAFVPAVPFAPEGETKPEQNLYYLLQQPNMRETEREEFLAEFAKEHEGSLVGLCVMGGIFSEGIDLTDDRLIGVIIVGTGLPMINVESEIAKEYFNAQERDGFAYAYRYPGMNKVMQAAGRVIRKETDRGIILLLDQRFENSEYRNLFPKEWSDYRTVNLDSMGKAVEKFWEKEF